MLFLLIGSDLHTFYIKQVAMAYFGKYIRQILARQETVVFPGFGSLNIGKGKGVVQETGQVEPPGAIVVFDPTHPKDNGILAQEYAQGENIDLEEAQQQLLELVDAIKFKMDKGESYDLALVGRFTRDDDNRIRFQKDPNWIIDPEIFGLSSLDLLELEEEEEEEKEEEKDAGESEEIPEKMLDKKKAQVIEDIPERKVAGRKPVNKWTIIWIVIASLITVLILILIIPLNQEDPDIEFGKEGLVIRNNADEGRDRAGKRDVKDPFEETKEVEIDKPASAEDTDTSVPVTTANRYFIIAGSFQNLQNASELLEQLKEKGYPAEMIFTESRLYRVAVKSYQTKQQAIQDLSRIKTDPGLEKVWVWTKE